MTKISFGSARVGFVLIGRNEGERLVRALSALPTNMPVVYVDSGSTDTSIAEAQEVGAEVVELDMSNPFTAARARNEGAERLLQIAPSLDYIQFLDGDCALHPDWLGKARAFLDSHPDAAVACGRRREQFPEASIYNYMIDQEWDTPLGEAKACGGDALIRVSAFQNVSGYNPDLIAGEEPEMCVRLRAAGWKIWRLDAEMTSHDAALTHLGQWWKRTRRAGHAYAEGAFLHGSPPERHKVRETRSAIVWGIALPVGILMAAILISPWLLAIFLVYPLQILRLRKKGYDNTSASFVVLGKFAEAHGIAEFYWRRLRGRKRGLIEYK